jgi:hypothetical protein
MRWGLILCYARTLESTHGALYLATGNVKYLQIVAGGLMLLNLPIDYIFLKLGFEPVVTMIIGTILEVICMSLAFLYLNKIVQFPIARFYRNAILPQLLVCIISLLPSILILFFWKDACFLRFCTVSIISVILSTFLAYYLVLNDNEKNLVLHIVRKKIKRR